MRYLQVFLFLGDFLGVRGEGLEDLTFWRCRGGAGRGSRDGGRDWASWSGKTLELIHFDVALQR